MEKYLLNFFQNLHKMLNTLRKIWASEVICFWNYRQEKAGLIKCLKSPEWEDLWAVNMLRGPKHCLNQHGSIFVVFFDQYEKKNRWKNIVSVVSEISRLFINILTSDDKTSLSVKVNVSSNQFKCIYREIEKYFLDSFLHLWNMHKLLNTLKERWASEVIFFWNYRLQKAGLLKCLKSPVSQHFWVVNMLKAPKECLNLHGSIFVRFFDDSERKSTRQILS